MRCRAAQVRTSVAPGARPVNVGLAQVVQHLAAQAGRVGQMSQQHIGADRGTFGFGVREQQTLNKHAAREHKDDQTDLCRLTRRPPAALPHLDGAEGQGTMDDHADARLAGPVAPRLICE